MEYVFKNKSVKAAEKKKPTKEILQQKYNILGETVAGLARKYGTTDMTVKRWMCFYGIQRKTPSQNATEQNRLKAMKQSLKHA